MTTSDAVTVPAPAALGISPLERARRIFVRPADAWVGLDHQVQWWIPLVFGLVLWCALQYAVYDRVTVPMVLDQYDKMVESGRLEAAQVEKMSAFYTDNPAARWIMLAQQAVVWPLLTFLPALVVWFGGGFVLGTKFRYRQALEVVSWAGLVRLPALLIAFFLAWQNESFQGVHLGLGVLLPESDPPSKLQVGLAMFLDQFGPFDAWWIFVGVLGVAALSGAPRKSTAWVMVLLYLALGAFFAAVAAFFSPGA